jgi:hypothetical protein
VRPCGVLCHPRSTKDVSALEEHRNESHASKPLVRRTGLAAKLLILNASDRPVDGFKILGGPGKGQA